MAQGDRNRSHQGWQRRLWSSGLGLVLLGGCGAGVPMATQGDMAPEGPAPAALEMERGAAVSGDASGGAGGDASGAMATGRWETIASTVPSAAPQLVKRATLGLTVTDIEAALEGVNQVLATHRGDLLGLSDGEGDIQPNRESQRQVYLELRVPAAALDQVLADLKGLGQVERQGLTAEDVSSQLVDLGARIRNLRRSEEALLEIMTRSGSVADILAVSQELSGVREAIERTEAQRQSLRGQVQFSTITLTLESQTPGAVPAISTSLGQTWRYATHSVGAFSITLLQLALWLLAYSPYWGSLLLAVWAYRRWGRSRRVPTPSEGYTEE